MQLLFFKFQSRAAQAITNNYDPKPLALILIPFIYWNNLNHNMLQQLTHYHGYR